MIAHFFILLAFILISACDINFYRLAFAVRRFLWSRKHDILKKYERPRIEVMVFSVKCLIMLALYYVLVYWTYRTAISPKFMLAVLCLYLFLKLLTSTIMGIRLEYTSRNNFYTPEKKA